MTTPADRPARSRRAVLAVCLVAVMSAATSAPALASGTTTTTGQPWVAGVGGTLVIGIDQAPTGCNPGTRSGDTWADRLVLEPVLPSAWVVNNNGQFVYDSAVITQAELQSTNPETIVYSINPKAVWSDGEPITAADFVYTWEQERGVTGPLVATSPGTITPTGAPPPATPSTTSLPGATAFTGPSLGYRQIQSITPSNKGRTVTVVFATPYADWQSLFNELMPAGVLQGTGWNPSCTTLDPTVDLSGGPFVLSSVSKSEIVLGRNPHWWETRPDVRQIVFKIASGPSQLAAWLAAGKVNVTLATGFTPQYTERISGVPSLATLSQLTDTLLELEFSTTSPVTEAETVRTAIAHSLDRQDLVNTVVGWEDSTIAPAVSHFYTEIQSGYPAPKPTPIQVAGQPGTPTTTAPATPTTSTPFPTAADPGAAAKLLGGLGYTKNLAGHWVDAAGQAVTLRLAYDDADTWAAASATVVHDQLTAAGFTVTLVQEPSAQSAGTALATGTADLAVLPLHSDPYATQAIAWFTPLLGPAGVGGSQDWSNLDDPTLNSYLVKASQQLNPTYARSTYQKADTVLWQDMAALPLFDEPAVLAYSRLVAGADLGPDDSSLLWSPSSWSIRVRAGSSHAAPAS